MYIPVSLQDNFGVYCSQPSLTPYWRSFISANNSVSMISVHFHWKLITLDIRLHSGLSQEGLCPRKRKKRKPNNKQPVKYSKYLHCWCSSQGRTRVSRANDANFGASAFELGKPESQRTCQQRGPQLKHGPTSTNHLNHKPRPCGSWAVEPSWQDRNYLARTPWRLLLQTGTRTRTVIARLKEHSSGTAEKLNFYIKKWMSMSSCVYKTKNSFRCLPAKPKTS